jgi:hypothetical protein
VAENRPNARTARPIMASAHADPGRTKQRQNVSTLSASAQSFAASGGVVQIPLTFAKCSSVAPRATPQPCQT